MIEDVGSRKLNREQRGKANNGSSRSHNNRIGIRARDSSRRGHTGSGSKTKGKGTGRYLGKRTATTTTAAKSKPKSKSKSKSKSKNTK